MVQPFSYQRPAEDPHPHQAAAAGVSLFTRPARPGSPPASASGAPGGSPIAGTIAAVGAEGGKGGNGAIGIDSGVNATYVQPTPGSAGGAGYVLIIW
jgi:hypothetical protein